MTPEVTTGPEITVFPCPVESAKKMGTPDFAKLLLVELSGKNLWRSLSSLANSLQVDEKELATLINKDPQLVRRHGKDSGVFYYALFDRLSKPLESEKNEKESDYALAMLHMVYFLFWKTLKTYALEIGQKDTESFNNLSQSLDKLETGLLLFSKKTKAEIEKLPKFS